MRISPVLFVSFGLMLAGPTTATRAAPNVHPHRLVLELAAGTPRPGHGRAQRPHAPSDRLASSGLPELDAVHARHQPLVYEPMFPTATPPPPGSQQEDLTRFYLVELPANGNLAQALADYGAVPGVAGAEPVPLASVDYVPDDPMVGTQWQLGQPSDHDGDVFEAWDLVQGDSSIVIAILDTGVLYSHEDLGGTAAPWTAGNIAHNWIEMGGLPGVDDDANGYVDDFRGWDFVTSGFGVPGEDVSGADNDPIDFAGHGTFVAGMASARTDNGAGIAGTGFRAKLLALRIGYKDAPTSPGQIDIGYAAQAIVYATDNGAHVINCSWESFSTSALASAVNYAIAHGVTLCVAAGNANTESTGENYLASRGDCIDVAAIDRNDVRAGFSNYGTWVDVSAPGLSVTSTMGRMSVPSYLTSSGTSVAAPFVAGAVSLYQAHRLRLGLPLATPAETRQRVHDTGDNIETWNPGYAGKIGTRVNVWRMLADGVVDVPQATMVRGTGLALSVMPNPSVSATRLVLSRTSARAGEASTARDEVRIYSVTGQLVRVIEIPTSQQRVVMLIWDGNDERGRPVGAGLYFARARWSGKQADAKLVRVSPAR